MAIPPAFLDELRARTPLHGLIGRKTQLTKSGRNWKGCCPFHNENTPSFYVYDNHFHCFGCGAHGDAVTFVMRADSCDFGAAVERLAREAGLKLPRALPSQADTSRAAQSMTLRMIENKSKFDDSMLEAILATAAKILIRGENISAASILANAKGRIDHQEHTNWDGGFDIWLLRLAIPADVYSDLDDRSHIEDQIRRAISTAMEAVSTPDSIDVKIVTLLDEDPDWRDKVRHHIAGEGITNQGRIRSDNIAARQHEGLLFRSQPEIHFYNALKKTGVPFAPLSVVLTGGISYRRVEPDFVIYRNGLVMVVEIDGDLYHTETPADAHARLKFILDEGASLERITASECDTPEKAKEAVARVLATLEKRRKAR